MKKKYIIAILMISLFLISGCTQKASSDNDANNENSAKAVTEKSDIEEKSETNFLLKGITLSPKSFQGDDFTGFFEKAKEMGNNNEKEIGNDNEEGIGDGNKKGMRNGNEFIISWSGDWNELSNINNGGPKVITELAKNYNYIPLVIAQFFTQSTGKLLKPLDETTKKEYKNSAVMFAEKYKPKYIALGIEVNTLYTSSLSDSSSDFEEFVKLYNDIYDAVKAVSPDTKVFTIFQLEKMKGLNGGLFGGENDEKKAQWFLIGKFKTDIIAFTTYPGLIYKNPSEIPDDYYSSIRANLINLPEIYKQTPVAFTEIGWHSDASITGWESSEEEQAEFISRFSELTKGLNEGNSLEFLIWSFMYDQNTIQPFNSMGLIDKDGNSKAGWKIWTEK
ncbi:hypothetical protein HY636_05360 [Candidatus Woesearchaeota archaeon]|nr:hypothetical protein [Candidatus Woesearchaeota archaeon]